MSLPNTARPADPPANDLITLNLWKLDIKEYQKKLEDLQRNMEKVYALILGQCAPTICDRVEASPGLGDINTKSDAIRILSLIQKCLYQRATGRKSTHALIEVETELFWFWQGKRMSNSEYLERLSELVEVYKHLGGKPDTTAGQVRAIWTDPDIDEEQQVADAKSKAREECLSVLLLVKIDPRRYAQLIVGIENQFTSGKDSYSATISAAYDMLVNYKDPKSMGRPHGQRI